MMLFQQFPAQANTDFTSCEQTLTTGTCGSLWAFLKNAVTVNYIPEYIYSCYLWSAVIINFRKAVSKPSLFLIIWSLTDPLPMYASLVHTVWIKFLFRLFSTPDKQRLYFMHRYADDYGEFLFILLKGVTGSPTTSVLCRKLHPQRDSMTLCLVTLQFVETAQLSGQMQHCTDTCTFACRLEQKLCMCGECSCLCVSKMPT